jgi:hypothetical protein
MNPNRADLVTSSSSFFASNGNAWMKLTPEAAIETCRRATDAALVVVRIEGGIWHNQGFEARLDCIWDGLDPPTTNAETSSNNLAAAAFVRQESVSHSAFILTCAPSSGYTHRTDPNAA